MVFPWVGLLGVGFEPGAQLGALGLVFLGQLVQTIDRRLSRVALADGAV